MWLIAGLGNPGPAHRHHRHNIGFMAVDRIVGRYWPLGKWRERFQGETMEFSVEDQKLLALKPDTFMNMSGNSVGETARFFKIEADRIIVLHDDLDLEPGRFEIKKGGGHGGHNGLRSIDAQIGTGYWRIRLGIGHPVKMLNIANIPKQQKDAMVTQHVLSNFDKSELDWLNPGLDHLAAAFPHLLTGDVEAFRAALQETAPLA